VIAPTIIAATMIAMRGTSSLEESGRVPAPKAEQRGTIVAQPSRRPIPNR
jgi:hypothetical protein